MIKQQITPINLYTKIAPIVCFSQVINIKKDTAINQVSRMLDKNFELFTKDYLPNNYKYEEVHIEVFNYANGYMLLINPIIKSLKLEVTFSDKVDKNSWF